MVDTTDNVLKQAVFNKARKDKFIMVITLPKILREINSDILSQRSQSLIKQEALQFSIYGSPVPETSVPQQALGIYGQTYNVTSQVREPYAPITVNFTVDNRFSNWWVLWKWLEVLNDPRDSWMPDDFSVWQQGAAEVLNGANEKSDLIRKQLNSKQSKVGPQISKTITTQQIKMVKNYLDYQTTITVYGLDEYDNKMIQFDYYNAFITRLAGIEYNYRDAEEIESNFTFVFNQLEIGLVGPVF